MIESNKKINKENYLEKPEFPLIVMIIVILIFFGIAFLRIYYLDKTQIIKQIYNIQAKYAAESGLIIFTQHIQNLLNEKIPTPTKPDEILSMLLDECKHFDWKNCGFKNSSKFKIANIRKLPLVDDIKTPFLDEGQLYAIECIGVCGEFKYQSSGILSFINLFKHYAVVNSLNEYYYGKPLQKWITIHGNLDNFISANKEIFEKGYFSINGLCHSPEWLYKLYGLGLPDPFAPSIDGKYLSANYSPLFSIGTKSICLGPLYCRTPIIVDKHEFEGPVKTSSYLFVRDQNKAFIKNSNTNIKLYSSYRIQEVQKKIEGENILEWLSDRDSVGTGKIRHYWRPNFNTLRIYAKEHGIYISEDGIGYVKGKKVETNYFPQKVKIISEVYTTPLGIMPEQDVEEGTVITLASSRKFQNYNNMSRENLHNSNLVFSENSIFIRGDIENDVIIVTPKKIFITGSINKYSKSRVFLIAGLGVAISTHDLENVIQSNKEDQAFISSALKWQINAYIYKVGGGVYSSNFENFQKKYEYDGKKVLDYQLNIAINGATIEGNINRWIKALGEKNIIITWNANDLEKLIYLPVSVNLIQLKTDALE